MKTQLLPGLSPHQRRNETRRVASRVIRSYRSGNDIAAGDALMCAMAAAELLNVCESALKVSKQEERK
jgi:hypothetical protein